MEILSLQIGMAYREFAIEVGHKLKFDCDESWFSGIKKPIKPEDYTFLEMYSNLYKYTIIQNDLKKFFFPPYLLCRLCIFQLHKVIHKFKIL